MVWKESWSNIYRFIADMMRLLVHFTDVLAVLFGRDLFAGPQIDVVDDIGYRPETVTIIFLG